jgi:acyl-coenzyme A thioesterase PaaI-like protein
MNDPADPGHEGNSGWAAGLARPHDPDAAEAFTILVDHLRTLQDAIGGACPPVAVIATAADQLKAVTALLAPYNGTEAEQLWSRIDTKPGHAQAMIPAIHYTDQDDASARGVVRFSRFYLGVSGAAHGGALCLVFDEMLGALAGAGSRPRPRTAYLHVNYRAVAPIGRELTLSATVTREEGRKVFINGELRDGLTVLADAEGLWVHRREGQT